MNLNELLIIKSNNIAINNVALVLTRILLCVVFVCLIVPFSPHLPVVGLDASWNLVAAFAAANKLSFGRDIILNIGPYSALFSHFVYPNLYALVISVSFFFATIFCFLFVKLDFSSNVALNVSYLFGVLLFCSPDDLLSFYFVLCAITVVNIDSVFKNQTLTTFFVIVGMFAAVGLLALVKGTHFFEGVLLTVMAALFFIYKKKWCLAFCVVVVPLITAIALWLLIGQNISDFLNYFASILTMNFFSLLLFHRYRILPFRPGTAPFLPCPVHPG